jgi:xanthine dehydrogenase molybdenum-binding subunit
MSNNGNGKYKVIGTRPLRHDGTEKVTGRAIYGGDVRLTNMLYGAVLRSPHAHAKIKSINTAKAEALAGVKAVVTNADLPPIKDDEIVDLGEGPARLKYMRDNVLASDKALYRGHAIAAVAAINPHIADEAVSLIEVDYEVLPPVVTVHDAMREGATLVHEDLTTKKGDEDTGKKSNVAAHEHHRLGDPEKAFAEAHVIVEREVDTATVHQGYIEPHNATAMWNPDGQLTIWTSTQGAFVAQKQTGAILGHPLSKIKVIPAEIGGGFGGKIPVYLEPPAAVLSRKSGHPVKLIMSRADVFEGTGPTPGTYVRVKMGADKDGKIVAAEAYLAIESGAYPGSPMFAGVMCVLSCYEVPNGTIDGYDVVVNKPRSFAYRAPVSTQVAFATETVVDELAAKLDMDPLEFRLKNAVKEGSRRVDGNVYARVGCIEALESIRDSQHYKAPIGKNQGRGIAIGYWFNVGLKSAVTASVNRDGSVNLVEGSTDIGGTRTSISMQFAEVLGLDVGDINPQVADTSSIGYTDVTGGSRTTYATGWAAYNAAHDVKDKMLERAAKLWEVGEDQVEFHDELFRHKTDTTKKLNFKELAGQLEGTGGPVVGSGTVDAGFLTAGGSFAANIVDVEVDPETGKTSIVRFTAIQDAGTAIHPSYVEGQMQGGSVQGIGWALNEEYFYNEEGTMVNSTFLDYRIPTCLDLPMIETIIVEVPNPTHPFGVRGVGEANIAPPPAAICNAINDAVGVHLAELPMRPDRLLAALQQKQTTEAIAAG